jgi:hypothetical protein
MLSWVMSILSLLGFTALFVFGLDMKSLSSYLVQWEWLVTSIWSVSTANDLMISVTLVVLLRNQHTNVHQRYDFGMASELKGHPYTLQNCGTRGQTHFVDYRFVET